MQFTLDWGINVFHLLCTPVKCFLVYVPPLPLDMSLRWFHYQNHCAEVLQGLESQIGKHSFTIKRPLATNKKIEEKRKTNKETKHHVPTLFLVLLSDIDVFIIRNHSQSQKTSDYHRRRVTELGIPFGVVVDAAFHDDRRKKSYVFTNRWVWRYDDERGELDNGYPRRSHHEFRGLMRHRPSAAVTLNGKGFLLIF